MSFCPSCVDIHFSAIRTHHHRRTPWVWVRSHSQVGAECAFECGRAPGARVCGTRPVLASLPVYPLPFRVVTAQLYPQIPVFRLSCAGSRAVAISCRGKRPLSFSFLLEDIPFPLHTTPLSSDPFILLYTETLLFSLFLFFFKHPNLPGTIWTKASARTYQRV